MASRHGASAAPAVIERAADPLHIVSVGWSLALVTGILDPIKLRTGIKFSHVVISDRDVVGGDALRDDLFPVRDARHGSLPPAEPALLASLEGPGIPTVHNMILGDRSVRMVPYNDALSYATLLARRFLALFEELRPSVVLGGFDSLHAGIALGVARQLGIPWFAMSFTTIPKGYSSFCTGLTPDTAFAVCPMSEESLRTIAERTLHEFEQNALRVPAYVSANSLRDVVMRLPSHLQALFTVLSRTAVGHYDRFTEFSTWQLAKQYVRKRTNLFLLPIDWFYDTPPTRPYVFFGLHMQPESSIDVWAPFHANQLAVVESMARSIPSSHELLVKLHRSDADNYTREQLDRFRRIPGVKLVSPFAPSRPFVESAALIMAIQGTVALEAGLLGKPVIMFGRSTFAHLPSISVAGAPDELPALVRRKLSEVRPTREAVIRGYMAHLSHFSPGCYNDWNTLPSEAELDALAAQFESLRVRVEQERARK